MLVPGAPEAAAEARSDDRGVVIDAVHAAGLRKLGERLGLAFPG